MPFALPRTAPPARAGARPCRPGPRELEPAVLDPLHVEEVLEQRSETAALGVDDPEVVPARLEVEVPLEEERREAEDAGERRPQLVRDDRDQLGLEPLALAQLRVLGRSSPLLRCSSSAIVLNERVSSPISPGRPRSEAGGRGRPRRAGSRRRRRRGPARRSHDRGRRRRGRSGAWRRRAPRRPPPGPGRSGWKRTRRPAGRAGSPARGRRRRPGGSHRSAASPRSSPGRIGRRRGSRCASSITGTA